MPLDRPTFGQLIARVSARYRAKFRGADLNLRFSPDRAIVQMVAGSSDEGLGFLDKIKDQAFPFSAEREYLERWGAMKGVRAKEASKATGVVALSGTAGKVAVADTELQTADGVVVALMYDTQLGDDGTVNAPAKTVEGGAAGNIGDGVGVTFIGTPAGFADTGTVQAPFAGGADAESTPSLRVRVFRAYSQPSFGGNQNDWENAALAVDGVTRVFIAPAVPTPGAVTIWPLLDGLRDNGIPVGDNAWFRPGTGPSAGAAGTGDQRAILDALLVDATGTKKRPICAHLYVTALATHAIDVEIANLTNDTPATRDAIAAELQAMLLRRVKPGGAISRTWVDEAISRAAGEDSHDLVVPAGNTAIAAGAIAILGNITYS